MNVAQRHPSALSAISIGGKEEAPALTATATRRSLVGPVAAHHAPPPKKMDPNENHHDDGKSAKGGRRNRFRQQKNCKQHS